MCLAFGGLVDLFFESLGPCGDELQIGQEQFRLQFGQVSRRIDGIVVGGDVGAFKCPHDWNEQIDRSDLANQSSCRRTTMIVGEVKAWQVQAVNRRMGNFFGLGIFSQPVDPFIRDRDDGFFDGRRACRGNGFAAHTR